MAHALANNSTAGSSLQDFDLSRNKSLRRLEFPTRYINGSPGTTLFLKHVLSTVTPSAALEVCLFHGEHCPPDTNPWRLDLPRLTKAERRRQISRYRRRFEVMREMHKVRAFELVLRASIWGRVGEEPMQVLKEAIAEEKAEGGFDEFPCKPSVVYDPREFLQGHHQEKPDCAFHRCFWWKQ